MTGWPVWTIGAPRLLAGLDLVPRVDGGLHQRIHGTPPALDRAAYASLATTVGLLGRGGAAFPVARKLSGLPRSGAHAVVVNGSESEPLSGKDRVLLQRAPHLVLDGAIGLARALRAKTVVVSVHDLDVANSVALAAAERPDGRIVTVLRQPAHFVAGEARSVVRGADGGPSIPPGRRTLPTVSGLAGRPTFLSNAETFAQLAVLARLGPRQYADRGVSVEPGTSLLTITGAVRSAGVVELPNGIPLSVVLEAAGAIAPDQVLVGGYHGLWASLDDNPTLSRPALAEAGLSFGAGVVAVLPPDTCPLGEVTAAAEWLARQSAGQCGPCVFGLPAIVRIRTVFVLLVNPQRPTVSCVACRAALRDPHRRIARAAIVDSELEQNLGADVGWPARRGDAGQRSRMAMADRE